ncbi:hypothetical protein FE257_000178 [Aspergillus nanangensis]|uniref:GrpB domain protein n=1 Tax=Aspergillus nanangensis TaxID=2582783 RepID=A0AAD4CYX1_ASPNN|nr:hypothetical protein FE257_000178 [Aspergillus nanangensis]
MALPYDITKHIPYDPLGFIRISNRTAEKPIEIIEWQPTWTASFQTISQRISQALGDRALQISHVGSTSVPGLPAKDVIDVDITVRDPTAEADYVPALEAAGFQFLHREPYWHEHRFFGLDEPYANIHVFGPESPELVRHRIFRDWLRAHEDDRNLYVKVKRESAAKSRVLGESGMQYNDRKEAVIREILGRVYKAHGYLE